MVEQLRAGKIDVSVNPEKHPNGRFARLHDPEGDPIKCGNRYENGSQHAGANAGERLNSAFANHVFWPGVAQIFWLNFYAYSIS